MSWYDAINECKKQSYNGHLASISDQQEHDYLVNLIMSDIGLMTTGQNGFTFPEMTKIRKITLYGQTEALPLPYPIPTGIPGNQTMLVATKIVS